MAKLLTDQRIMTRQEIIAEARRIVKDVGSQVRAAEHLNITQAAISKALKEGNTMDNVRRKILEQLGGWTVDPEPHFIATPPAGARGDQRAQ